MRGELLDHTASDARRTTRDYSDFILPIPNRLVGPPDPSPFGKAIEHRVEVYKGPYRQRPLEVVMEGYKLTAGETEFPTKSEVLGFGDSEQHGCQCEQGTSDHDGAGRWGERVY